jgi:2-dehydro-3-deoxyphosphogluconate aldolase/(4S)-4-hydroxy-2-oxoglutarate aldolase
MHPNEFVALLGRERASAILRTSIDAAVAPAMTAALAAGFRIAEFTLTIPDAYSHIEAFARRGEGVIGAGTVLTPEEARRAVGAGAQFLVSPVVDEAVIGEASRLGVAMMPGTHTPTEMLRAARAGAPLQKLFPAPAPGYGPAYVRACLGPMPFLRLVPTHGVDESNAAEWLRAGAFAVGFVAPLFDPGDLAAGRFQAVTERGRRLLAAVRSAA